MRQSKAAYKRLIGYIEHNTLNTVQGPTVSKGSVINVVSRRHSVRVSKKALEAAKHNNDVIHDTKNNKLLLFEQDRIQSYIEQEANRETPNKELIGHLNGCLMHLSN